jgi:hypothetical protein
VAERLGLKGHSAGRAENLYIQSMTFTEWRYWLSTFSCFTADPLACMTARVATATATGTVQGAP